MIDIKWGRIWLGDFEFDMPALDAEADMLHIMPLFDTFLNSYTGAAVTPPSFYSG